MKRIVVVDDDESILAMMQAALELGGYGVETCSTGAGLLLALCHLPDIIFLDISLKDEDGRRICRQLKSQEQTRHLPVILCSAHLRAQKGLEQSFADDFLEKPFHLTELLAKAQKYTSIRYNNISEKKQYTELS